MIYSVVYLRAFERRCRQRVINIAEKSGEETTSQSGTFKFPSSELLSAHRHGFVYAFILRRRPYNNLSSLDSLTILGHNKSLHCLVSHSSVIAS